MVIEMKIVSRLRGGNGDKNKNGFKGDGRREEWMCGFKCFRICNLRFLWHF